MYNINILVLFIILITHWYNDFVLQTDYQAKNKSSSNRALLSHTAIYSICWLAPISIYILIVHKGFNYIMYLFIPITFICHTIQDYITSRINKRLYQQNKIHQFFVSVGFDQLLHYTQLIITFKLLE